MFQPDFSLPIQQTIPELYNHLLDHPNCILVAPPGTGKTSLIPLSLIDAPWRQHKKIIMLEPRRIATRAAAKQMATLLHEPIGQTIGYRTRLEKAISQQTIIEVVTHGLFLRYLLNNPFLDQVAGIIFDEIHERSLETDLCLALCHNLQKNLRPDLRLIAMSATPSLTNLQTILDCKIIKNESTLHPVTIHYRKRDLTTLNDLPKITALEIQTIYQQEQGNILAFLPGIAEIHRTLSLLSIDDAEILPLYGDLPSIEQDKALRVITSQDKRRIVLATSIAETSLTVPGVNIVVDGGFRKLPHFNGDTGLTRLLTQRISKAAADQRAGRAGRQKEGKVYRLWTQATQRSLTLHDRPEILSSELSEFLLICQSWITIMGISMKELVFPDPPANGMIEAASKLLTLLGALDQKGQITNFGQKIIQFGSHPRLASMMLRAKSNEEKALTANLAALLEERDPLCLTENRTSDIQLRLDWLHNKPMHHEKGLWFRIQKISQEYRKRLHIPPQQKALGNPAPFLCAAFPDRLAQRRNEIGSFRFAGGGGAYLSQQDLLAKENLLAIANVHTQKRTTICLAAPISLSLLPTFIQEQLYHTEETSLDSISGKIITRERIKFGNLILQDKNITATKEQAFPVLLHYVQNNLSKTLNWDTEAKQLQARCALAKTYLKNEAFPDLSDESLKLHIDQWLSPWITQTSTLGEIKNLKVKAILESYLGYALSNKLNKLFPSFIILNHHKVLIDYTQSTPTISAKAQNFYGLKETPTIAKGRITLQCCLLSPAGRPQAITNNLHRFWKEGWKDMRKDMKGRYPKHNWPEKPMDVTANIQSKI